MLCIGSSYVPVAAVVDYELTLTCPYRLTADTAIDALTHAIEAYVSRKHSVLSDRYALNSMKTVNKYIREACNNPSSTTAREQLMIAATEGGMAFSISSVAMVHGMSRPLGAVFHVPHGLSNAMLLPDVTRFGIETNPERYAQCAAAMGFASDSASVDNAAAALLEGLEQMCHDLKVPSLSQFGVKESQYRAAIDRMVSEAQASGSPGNNPRVPTDAEMARVYNVVYR
ncbi:hypothetical protein SARC_03853 [Sphaeroforma arctica JP610]|uniref:Fe-containing alcohol dehydrogenase-like C-terminal domain-containing protein n=1 Tax=Sphaeroforma arctica JP610 TaxID=667725 RepID=A0A0L0G6Q6_9EUKA|nr:hypothetical protein SARC_03853 [Sphaeroforma arctica JP610]KNC83918.1 hypothetical protein SARC_03853 [Sphaeroforma arctica JP610]|eukprot:XP_014157820.1 hypothetical protein SARC_03853 [Sphaeroforma arctica JP610]